MRHAFDVFERQDRAGPRSATPASYRRAMCGCSSAARMSRSRAMRSASCAPRQAPMRQFQRHRALEHAVGALGQPHRAHAAAAELAHQPIGTDDGIARAGLTGSATPATGGSWSRKCSVSFFEASASRRSRRGFSKAYAARASRAMRALIERQIQRFVEQAAHLRPAGAIYLGAHWPALTAAPPTATAAPSPTAGAPCVR